MRSVRDPRPDPGVDRTALDGAGAPAVAKATKPVTEAAHVVLGQHAPAINMQGEAEELGRLACRDDLGLVGVKARKHPARTAGQAATAAVTTFCAAFQFQGSSSLTRLAG